MTRARTRYGCFLPDLTGLARNPSTANLPPLYISNRGGGGKGLDATTVAVMAIVTGAPEVAGGRQRERHRHDSTLALNPHAYASDKPRREYGVTNHIACCAVSQADTSYNTSLGDNFG